MEERWSQQGWNISFLRHLNEWEVARFVELIKVLDGFTGISTEPDTITWKHDKDGKFSVNRTYKNRQVWSLKQIKTDLGNKSERLWLLPRSNVLLG